jgi:hypothetical protein
MAGTFARAPAEFPELIPLVARWMEMKGGGAELMKGLLKYGPKAKDAVPALRKFLRERVVDGHTYPDSEWQLACELLGGIGPDAKAALPELRYRLDSGSIEVALAARDAIQKITGEK